MQSVAKFVTKAYPVSGCCDYLSEVRTERERPLAVPPRAGVRWGLPSPQRARGVSPGEARQSLLS